MGLQKGQTNNANGRPVGSQNKSTKAIKDLIDSVIDTQELINELAGIAKDKENRASFEAIKLLLAYRYGKPKELLEVQGEQERVVYDLTSVDRTYKFVEALENYSKGNTSFATMYQDLKDRYDKENPDDLIDLIEQSKRADL